VVSPRLLIAMGQTHTRIRAATVVCGSSRVLIAMGQNTRADQGCDCWGTDSLFRLGGVLFPGQVRGEKGGQSPIVDRCGQLSGAVINEGRMWSSVRDVVPGNCGDIEKCGRQVGNLPHLAEIAPCGRGSVDCDAALCWFNGSVDGILRLNAHGV
jgi:hypothetical protein